MNKVGIMTLYKNNYGAFLQAYALQRTLFDIGYDAEIINYNSRKYKCFLGVELSYLKNDPVTFAKLVIPAIIHYRSAKKKQSNFDQSIADKLKVGKREYTSPMEIASQPPQYDVYITGSDQVFNPKLRPYAFPVRCLHFADGHKVVKASYAASVAQKQLSHEDSIQFSKYLNDFSGISIREKSSVEMIQACTENPVEANIDPTLLLKKESWNQFAEISNDQQDYILVYKLKGQPDLDQYVETLAKQTGLRIINCGRELNIHAENMKQESNLSPEKFVGRFIGAKYIVTNSFHGTVFSVIFHKQARIFVPQETGMRITELLDLTGLQCLLQCDVTNENLSQVYEMADNRLEKERMRSVNYLKQWYVPAEKKVKERSVAPVIDSFSCCGCASCVNQCPKKLIQIKENSRGFLSAVIDDTDTCVNCGLCKKVCPMTEPRMKLEVIGKVWYGHANDDELLKKSSSGAVFGMMAKRLISEGWIVYGAAMDMQTGNVRHVSSEYHSLDEMLMSKYVQSDAYGSFDEIKKHLQNGKKVLFSGTPCQVYGLKRYIGDKVYSGVLLTVDFICHGVPSRRLFRDYYQSLNDKIGKITHYEFRTKIQWPDVRVSAKTSKNRKYQVHRNLDQYSSMYIQNATLNRSCVDCAFREKHFGDITIADFWGWSKVQPPITDYKKGLSLVITNTDEGNRIFEATKCDGVFNEIDGQYAAYAYKRRKGVMSMLSKIDLFFDEYERNGYEGVCKKYASNLRSKAILRKLHIIK